MWRWRWDIGSRECIGVSGVRRRSIGEEQGNRGEWLYWRRRRWKTRLWGLRPKCLIWLESNYALEIACAIFNLILITGVMTKTFFKETSLIEISYLHIVLFLIFQMAGRLAVQERSKIAACYDVRNSIVLVQKWWRPEKSKHATLHPETIKKLSFKADDHDICEQSRKLHPIIAENVVTVPEIFNRSPQKSTR